MATVDLGGDRPDLTKAALAVHRSLKVSKSGVKKRNTQASKFQKSFTTLCVGPHRTYITMSVKRSVGVEDNGDKAVRSIAGSRSKRAGRSFNRCFSFMEVPMEPGVSSLKELDSNKLKAEIKRWAKAVVGYARQLSGRLGRSSRKSNRYGSSQSSSSHAA